MASGHLHICLPAYKIRMTNENHMADDQIEDRHLSEKYYTITHIHYMQRTGPILP